MGLQFPLAIQRHVFRVTSIKHDCVCMPCERLTSPPGWTAALCPTLPVTLTRLEDRCMLRLQTQKHLIPCADNKGISQTTYYNV